MFAQSVVVLEHRLVGAHVKITLKPVQVAVHQLQALANYAANFNWVTRRNVLTLIVCVGTEVDNLDFSFYYLKICAVSMLISKRDSIAAFLFLVPLEVISSEGSDCVYLPSEVLSVKLPDSILSTLPTIATVRPSMLSMRPALTNGWGSLAIYCSTSVIFEFQFKVLIW